MAHRNDLIATCLGSAEGLTPFVSPSLSSPRLRCQTMFDGDIYQLLQ